MSQMNFVEFEKTRFTAHSFQSELDVIQDIKIELATKGRLVTNKAIMIKLISMLETESDVVKLDIYRNALEAVVFRTPDDLV
ncbi:biofilm development regulator YmgB/AriR family protein [Rouxiella chamberiensis]|uniref:Biofilm development regulator YmgB/AriR family protein n=1 Tax=Rouxiella chamberiensis TaxID=1513468 RepID=A0ABY7HTR6_9GAMM|nr:biofilm development regulator YmgB/AriR family protein [Rouxiella chamberiensis]WAT02824.1 biofilm development regulator YmgB/AriR family protein [Rouxiella chamberiensis]